MTGQILRQLRKGAGLSQGQLALRLEVDNMTISRWERGINPMSKLASLAVLAAIGGLKE